MAHHHTGNHTGSLFTGYHSPTGRYDEMFAAPGQPRPHWQALYDSLNATRARDLNTRISVAERELRDSGVTYNVYEDPEGLNRQWEMDMLPMAIAPAEWQALEPASRSVRVCSTAFLPIFMAHSACCATACCRLR